MAKIKHIALSTQDVDKTAKFYIDVFGMKEIANQVGYESESAFSNAFKRWSGTAPGAYRRGKE